MSYQFYETDRDRGFVRGAKWDAYPIAGALPHLQILHGSPLAERFGPRIHENMRRLFGRSLLWTAQTDDLPVEALSIAVSRCARVVQNDALHTWLNS